MIHPRQPTQRFSTTFLTQGGFTIVEMSVCLVIIGLLVGAIAVGRAIIAASEVRAQISQVEKYTIAVNAFRAKYNYLPGDLPAEHADSVGFVGRSGESGSGDGNGRVEYWDVTHGDVFEGELVMFWSDLSKAAMIEGAFAQGDVSVNCNPPFCGTLTIASYMPVAKIHAKAYILAYSNVASAIPGYNGLVFELLSTTRIMSGGQVITDPAIPVRVAYSIDLKIDDGMPLAGRVVSAMPGRVGQTGYIMRNSEDGWWPGHGASSAYCVLDAEPLVYNMAHSDIVACSLLIGAGL